MEKLKKQEIALKIFRFKTREKGIKLSKNQNRELGNIAKETEIPQEEFSEIFE